MFTGIVEELGTVRAAGASTLDVACVTVLDDADLGASIAVSGVCLTVAHRGGDHVGFDLSEETLARTCLGRLRAGDPVNLERPVSLAARLGGHVVQGHVDGIGEVTEVRPAGEGAEVWFAPPGDLWPYIVEKGSIAIDGVSLTVAGLRDGAFAVALIPHTLAVTTLGRANEGTQVNVEVDVMAKYVERLMEGIRT